MFSTAAAVPYRAAPLVRTNPSPLLHYMHFFILLLLFFSHPTRPRRAITIRNVLLITGGHSGPGWDIYKVASRQQYHVHVSIYRTILTLSSGQRPSVPHISTGLKSKATNNHYDPKPFVKRLFSNLLITPWKKLTDHYLPKSKYRPLKKPQSIIYILRLLNN